MMKKWLTGILMASAVAVLCVSGWHLHKDYNEQKDSDAQIAMKPDILSAEDDPEIFPLMDFTALEEQNEEIIAWLTIDGLGIEYPILQSVDNSYYLTHTAEKKGNKQGAIFLDYRNSYDFSDFYSIVYGHNIKGGKMLGNLPSMKESGYFHRITTGMLYTPAKTYRLEIFAVVVAGSTSDFYRYIFPDTASLEAHLDMIREHAKQYRDIGVTTQDRLVALSTCSYEYKNARTIVIARLDG